MCTHVRDFHTADKSLSLLRDFKAARTDSLLTQHSSLLSKSTHVTQGSLFYCKHQAFASLRYFFLLICCCLFRPFLRRHSIPLSSKLYANPCLDWRLTGFFTAPNTHDLMRHTGILAVKSLISSSGLR